MHYVVSLYFLLSVLANLSLFGLEFGIAQHVAEFTQKCLCIEGDLEYTVPVKMFVDTFVH